MSDDDLEPAAWRCKLCDYATNNMHKLRSHAKINHKPEYKDAQHADGWYVDAIYEKTVRLSDVRELLDEMQRKVNQDLEEDDEIGHDFRMAGIAAMDILNSYIKQRLPKFTQNDSKRGAKLSEEYQGLNGSEIIEKAEEDFSQKGGGN